MADQPTSTSDWPPDDDRQAELLARRHERRRQRARRRRIVGGIVIAVTALAVAAILLTRGGGRNSSERSNTSATHAPSPSTTKHSSLVRNATPQPGWAPHTGPVPIFEYHVLGDPAPDTPYPELYVTRSDFSRQMDWLDSHGYEAVTLNQVEKGWYHDGKLPPKPVVLSFDDGYRPQFTFALPVLRSHGWAGLLNLKAEGSDLYTSNVEAMIRAGWELAAHTIHHLDLTTLDASQLKLEVAGSRNILRHKYHVPVDNFCYPAGQFDSTVIAAVRAAGYVGATTEIPGYATRDKPYELSRFEILRSTGVSGLAGDLG